MVGRAGVWYERVVGETLDSGNPEFLQFLSQ